MILFTLLLAAAVANAQFRELKTGVLNGGFKKTAVETKRKVLEDFPIIPEEMLTEDWANPKADQDLIMSAYGGKASKQQGEVPCDINQESPYDLYCYKTDFPEDGYITVFRDCPREGGLITQCGRCYVVQGLSKNKYSVSIVKPNTAKVIWIGGNQI